MTECQLAVSSIGVMQRLERSVDRRLWGGTAAQAAAVTMKNEVGDDWVGRRHELAGSDRVALDRVIHETPWQPPWSRPAVVDAARAELQGCLWHGRSGIDKTPDELQHWEWTGVVAVDMPEAWPGRNCRSRAWSVQETQPVNESSHRWHNDKAGGAQRSSVTQFSERGWPLKDRCRWRNRD